MNHQKAVKTILSKTREKKLYKLLRLWNENESVQQNAFNLNMGINTVRVFIHRHNLKYSRKNPLLKNSYSRRPSSERKNRRIKLWDSSKTLRENAKKLGISYSYISTFVNSHGLPYTKVYKTGIKIIVNPKQRLNELRNKILALRKEGLTLEHIGKVFGLTRERIRQIEGL